MAKRGPKSKYSDEKLDMQAEKPDDRPECVLHLNGPRKYNPGGEDTGEGPAMSMLVDNSVGDWSLRPARKFPSKDYRGEPRNVRDVGYTEETKEHTLARISHQVAARAAHFQAGDYNRHGGHAL